MHEEDQPIRWILILLALAILLALVTAQSAGQSLDATLAPLRQFLPIARFDPTPRPPVSPLVTPTPTPTPPPSPLQYLPIIGGS